MESVGVLSTGGCAVLAQLARCGAGVPACVSVLLIVAFEPFEHSAEVFLANHRVLRSEDAVTRAREPDEFDFFAVAFERDEVLFRLFDWDSRVVFSVQ